MIINVVSLCTFFFSRNWLQHPLCPAGFAPGTVALQIQDGKTSSSHFCSAVGCHFLSYGWVRVWASERWYAFYLSCQKRKKTFKTHSLISVISRPGLWAALVSCPWWIIMSCCRCCLHFVAHLHVLDRLLAYCCHLHCLAHHWLEHSKKRQVIKAAT